jgi:hypothetical protein
VNQVRSFLSIVKEEGNAEFRQEWERPSALEQLLPGYEKQKKRPNLFKFGLWSSLC